MPRILVFLIWISLPAAAVHAGHGPELSHPDRMRASYGFGYNLGRSYRAEKLPVVLEQFFAGMRDGFSGKKPKVTKRQYQKSITAMNDVAEQSFADFVASQGAENLKKGRAFMAQNKRRSGVETLPGGVQVEILNRGDPNQRSPDSKDLARVHYKGALVDGTVFEDTTRGNPVWLPVDGIVKGLSQALRLMRVGDKWRIVIPPDLGYGREGDPPSIGPSSVLVFELEIMELKRIQTKPVKSQLRR